MTLNRCAWCPPDDPLYCAYHDEEWGVPVHDDRRLFEMLILEGAQAGLNWRLILSRRGHYRRAFDGFDPAIVAGFDAAKAARLLTDAGIIRNRLKVAAAIQNARGVRQIQAEFGSLDAYLWRFVDGRPIQNHWRSINEIPTHTPLSDRISRELKQRGFSFVGTTIIYSFMQAVGMVNDHEAGCFRHAVLTLL